MDHSIQRELAEFIAGCDGDKIPERLFADIKYRVLDWLGCAVVGRHYEQSDIARKLFTGTGGRAEATIIGADGLYPIETAAMVNGIIGHVSEFDDGHRKAIGHPGSITLPVALALAEGRGVRGGDFLKSLILGYDVFIRAGQAVNPSHYTYWHTTATCGTFAAAATAASLLKLSAEETCNALGIAATLAGGLVASFGFHAKALNVGNACQNGIRAARLAQAGFTGSDSAMTGDRGFLRATTEAEALDIVTPTEETLLSDTAFFKAYTSCGHTNSPLDVMCAIMRDHPLDPAAIREITVSTYQVSVNLTGALKARNETEAKFSLPYCIAVLLICGRVTLAEFTPEMLSDPDILALARKVRVRESAEATARFPKRQAEITVTMEDGQVFEDRVLDSTDVVDYPALEKKFLDQVRGVDPERSQAMITFLREMGTDTGLAPLFQYLRQL